MLYENLRKIREENEYNQNDIAEILNITRQQYQLYESGKREMPAHLFVKLAKFYNVSTDYLLEISDNSNEIQDSDMSFRKLTERLANAYEEIEEINENYKKVQKKIDREASKLFLNSSSSIEWLLKNYRKAILRYTIQIEETLYENTK